MRAGALALALLWLGGCATADLGTQLKPDPRTAFPEKAEADAAADLAQGRVILYRVGGFASYQAGVPRGFDDLQVRAKSGNAGAGCIVDDRTPARND